MSKNKKKGQLPQESQPQDPGVQADQPASAPPPTVSEAAAQAAAPAVPRTYFFLFWGLIIAAVALAWSLEAAMPNVPEYVIERWIMAGLAAALAILLYVFK